jgi:MFS family permease
MHDHALDAWVLEAQAWRMGTRWRRATTGAVLLALVVSAFEGTVVTTAMPTIARELGGGSWYAWVFTSFLIASTVGVLVCGRLADAFGRRPVFAAGMGLFLVGSALCGAAPSIGALVFFRAIQGLGAGAVHPIAMVITGDIYTVRERISVQGLLTGTWGLANLIGPLLGGWIATHVGWRWVFYVNLPPGLFALGLLWTSYSDPPGRVKLLSRLISSELLRDGIVRTGLMTSLAGGALINTALAYVPPFVEHESHRTAFESGQALIALLLGWALGSAFGVRVLVRRGMHASVGGGFVIATVGFSAVSLLVGVHAPFRWLLPALFLTGMGLGPALSTSMVGPQARASWSERGMLTSIIYAMRTLGGAALMWLLGGQLSGETRFVTMAVLCAAAAVIGVRAPREEQGSRVSSLGASSVAVLRE